MSLLSRVSSVEQLGAQYNAYNPGAFSPERGLSPSPSQRARHLSFNPLPGAWDPPVLQDHLSRTGAFEVKKSRRLRKFDTFISLLCWVSSLEAFVVVKLWWRWE